MSKMMGSPGKMWEQFVANMVPVITRVVKFCKRLPGKQVAVVSWMEERKAKCSLLLISAGYCLTIVFLPACVALPSSSLLATVWWSSSLLATVWPLSSCQHVWPYHRLLCWLLSDDRLLCWLLSDHCLPASMCGLTIVFSAGYCLTIVFLPACVALPSSSLLLQASWNWSKTTRSDWSSRDPLKWWLRDTSLCSMGMACSYRAWKWRYRGRNLILLHYNATNKCDCMTAAYLKGTDLIKRDFFLL